MRNQATGTPRETLSVEAARAIYTEMMQHDSVISKQTAIRDNAVLDIVSAMAKIEQAYSARKALSDQLDKFAPDGFLEADANGAVNVEHAYSNQAAPPAVPMQPAPMPYAPGYGPKPWHRADPRLKPTPIASRGAPTPGYDDTFDLN